MNRRDFVRSTAASLALAAGGRATADAKPRVGVIGCGWFGMWDLQMLMDVASVDVIGLSDVDQQMLDKAASWVEGKGQKRPKLVKRYQELLAEKPDIVIVGTPDHWHPLAMIDAVKAGADVYVEKPICVDVTEGQAMVAAARKHDRRVQVGTQRRSTPHIKRAKDFINGGAIGNVVRAHSYCYYHMRGGPGAKDNPPDSNPPASLDYELWTGPAPMRPYNALVHPRTWRRFMEYGNGIIGDMGVHMLDTVRFILNLNQPKRIDSMAGTFVQKNLKPNISDTQNVTYDFGNTIVTWEHRTWGQHDKKYPWGIDFCGEKGTVRLTLDFWEHWPNNADQPAKRDQADLVEGFNEHDNKIVHANRGQWRNLLECIANRGRPVADIEEGYKSTAMCILGNVSAQLGRGLTWDGTRCVGDDEANKLLTRPYRPGYTHPV